MIEPGDQVILHDWGRDMTTGVALWKVAQVDYAQGIMELDLKPGTWHDMRIYRIAMTKEEAAEYALTGS